MKNRHVRLSFALVFAAAWGVSGSGCDCSADPSVVGDDGGSDSGRDSGTDAGSEEDGSVVVVETCGDGVVSGAETCDTAIPSGPGSCPTVVSCDDGMDCTDDAVPLNPGFECYAVCDHSPITTTVNNDGCCPSGADSTTDNDCSVTCGNGIVEAGESCDTAIASGPGSCPASCDDGMACTSDSLLSAGTCNAQCAYEPITAPTDGDSCCPAGANTSNDDDCSITCGDGVVDVGESCDTAIAAGQPGACPAACNDGMVCTSDTLLSAGTCSAACSYVPITVPTDADGCCPAGANVGNDNDCSVSCGDGVQSVGESCDTAIAAGQPGACPTSCGDGMVCTTDVLLSAGTCAAVCSNTPITAPSNGDGCCPLGATLANDSDCPVACGDGVLSAGEGCDTGIASGPGSCPTVASCNDGVGCTADSLSGGGTCAAACMHVPITAPANGDSCCPPGATMANDNDCATVCGDGARTGGEACDTAIAAGQPGACPTVASCNDGVACTTDAISGTGCSQVCTNVPKTAGPADGCCPAGATIGTDPDCPVVCGDGVKSASEACDTAIVSPAAGSCPTVASCNDGVACTSDVIAMAGTCQAACTHPAITTPVNGDACCPSGANAGNDSDCPVVCGDGVKSPSEQCDDGNTVSGDGCNSPSCTPTCTADAQCDDANVCTLASTCTPAGANGARSCTTPSPASMATTCSPPAGGHCNGMGVCIASGPVCGNGMVESGEICDDNNNTRWDGCYGCQLEQVFRITNLTILSTTPAACANLPHRTGTSFNVVGPALNSNTLIGRPLDLVNTSVNDSITNGSFITLVHPMDVDNTLAARLGQTDANLRLAFFTGGIPSGAFDASAGAPFVINNSAMQLGASPFDPNPNQILSPASVASSMLTAGGGTGAVNVTMDLGTGPVPLRFYNALAQGTTSNDGTRITGVTSGVLCGAVRAGDLDTIMPTTGQVAMYCSGKSLLDVIGRGCTYALQTIASATMPNVDLGGDGFCTGNNCLQGSPNVNVCLDSSANVRIPPTGTDSNCAQNPAFDDAYGIALSYTGTWVTFGGTRTGP